MPHRSPGFTLLELLVVLALTGIVLSQAVPFFGNLVQTSHRHSEISELVTLLNLARHTAISEGQSVTVWALDIERECTKDWQQPVVAFRDPDRTRKVSDDAQVIRQFRPSERSRFTANTGIRDYFRFRSSGMAWEAIGNIIWCPVDGNPKLAVQLRINMGGRVQKAQDRNGDGVVENAKGQPVDCPTTEST